MTKHYRSPISTTHNIDTALSFALGVVQCRAEQDGIILSHREVIARTTFDIDEKDGEVTLQAVLTIN